MTALHLLLYISAAFAAQILLGGVLMLRRASANSGHSDAERAPERPNANPAAWPGWRDFRVERREFVDAAKSQCSFYLVPVDAGILPAYAPGQFLTVMLNVARGGVAPGAGAATVTRCYSLSDAPGADAYRVTVKRVLPPAVTPDLPPGVASGYLHDQVEVGSILKVKAPAGRFVLLPNQRIPLVLIAGGIGITPMMSMLNWSLAHEPDREVYLFYGVRCGLDHAFKKRLEELAEQHAGFHLNIAYSNPTDDDEGGRDFQHAGRVDIALLRSVLTRVRHVFYVCGPPPMMAGLVPALVQWGVASEDVHYEAFGPATVPTGAAMKVPGDIDSDVAFDVRFHRSGRTLAWDGQDSNLLAFAERHGIEMDSGCRSGSCGTCETRLRQGEMKYAARPDHETRAGYCLPCVGVPASALEIDA